MVDYNEYMKSPAWDKKRRARLKKDNYTCQDCDAKDKPLDVHHITYERLGRERMSDLISVCRNCHEERHRTMWVFFGICRTCGKLLAIWKQWLSDGWTRWTCQDGHINEKRGHHE
jgi:5-methylcytosine-specific restriction endonuclease McrA